VKGVLDLSIKREKPTTKKPSKKPSTKEAISVDYRYTAPIEDIVSKIESEVSKGTVKYYTPYTLALALNIKISAAKRALREATKRGILKLYSGGRRSPIFIPAK
jgi:small subunit ribosomal protein S25e